MDFSAVGIISPGDMGHAIGRVLVDHGVKVLTCLEGRSERTRQLASEAGIISVLDYGQFVKESEIILSVLVPSQAKNLASTISKALMETGTQRIYVDCNAVAPTTVKEIGDIITMSNSRFVDAGIIGNPPGPKSSPRIYASGVHAGEFLKLNKYGLDIRITGEEIGQASGLKMVYAAFTKGYYALAIELLVAARRMNLYDALIEEFKLSQTDRYPALNKMLQPVPSKSKRWIGEMEEIAKTFNDAGLTPKILEGAADIYKFVSSNPVANETAENIDNQRTLEQLIKMLS